MKINEAVTPSSARRNMKQTARFMGFATVQQYQNWLASLPKFKDGEKPPTPVIVTTNNQASINTLNTIGAAKRALATIAEELERREREALDGKCNWSHAGDAGKIRAELEDLIHFWKP